MPDGGDPELPLLPLRSMNLFPGVTLRVDLGRPGSVEAVQQAMDRRTNGSERRLLVATQRDPLDESPGLSGLHEIAVVGEIVQVVQGMPGRLNVQVRGVERVRLTGLSSTGDHLRGWYAPAPEQLEDATYAYALAGALQDLVAKHDELLPANRKGQQREAALVELRNARAPSLVSDMAAAHVELESEDRIALLQELSVVTRLRRVLELVSRRVSALQVQRDVDRQVREYLSKHEQEAFLRHKLRAIKSELGDDGDDARALAELEEALAARDLNEEARAAADRELRRLARMNPQSGEANVARTYLQWLADLPWGERDATVDHLDLEDARQRLDEGHYGIEKVKKRVLEYLSVRKLAPNKRGPILCLAGPPGTGKTTLARAIADTLGRSFVRISLGGVRDDAEIRGHRRTYVGAIPGRLVQSLKKAGTSNPLMLLDEIDKLVNADMRGDPASALLEALDPEQNTEFVDHYLGVGIDLSRVMFVCTANELGAIPPVLRDRLEVIGLGGYTVEEKLRIARGYLLPELRRDHGLGELDIDFDDDALELMAVQYTRESGVRNLRRNMASLLRDVAMQIAEGRQPPSRLDCDRVVEVLGPPRYHDEELGAEPRPGVATGLGWTPTGGRLLFVEAIVTLGKGKLRLTGRLGEVMKESGQAAMSLVRSRTDAFGIETTFLREHDLHIHLPAGAVPKDGPSAGIAVTSAIVSAATGRPLRNDVAMTGEVTLRGQVLPVGGIREKVLAAHRAGIRDVILPRRNRKDEDDIPPAARQDLRIHYVDHIDEVLAVVLLPAPQPDAPPEPAREPAA